jgi:hypothetical protein
MSEHLLGEDQFSQSAAGLGSIWRDAPRRRRPRAPPSPRGARAVPPAPGQTLAFLSNRAHGRRTRGQFTALRAALYGGIEAGQICGRFSRKSFILWMCERYSTTV